MILLVLKYILSFIVNYINNIFTFNKYILRYFFSYNCILCKIDLMYSSGLCAQCWMKLDIIGNNHCNICGKKNDLYCCRGKLDYNDTYHGNVYFRYAVKMNKYAKILIHRFKYYDEYIVAQVLSRLLFQHIDKDNYDYIIPVPMYYLKKIFRVYNSAFEIAKLIAEHRREEISIMSDLLYKKKYTLSQTMLNYKQRQVNIKASFGICLGERIRGKSIILVDDVSTTGATLNECVKTLLKYHPKKILCLSLAYN